MNELKHISASSLTAYNNCPLQWYYAYVLKLIQLPNPAFIIGTAYHKCLEQYHSDVDVEEILSKTKKDLMSNKPTDDEIKNYAMVRKMFEKYCDNFIGGTIIDREYKFSINIPGVPVPLIGFIDRVDEDKIVEYKTSSFDFKEIDIQTIQSRIYTYAVWKKTDKILPVHFSVNNKKKVNNKLYIPQLLIIQYTEKDMVNLELEIKNIWDEMANTISTNNIKNICGVHCFWCGYGKNGTGNCKKFKK